MSGTNSITRNYTPQELLQSAPPRESGWNKFGRVLGDVAGGLTGGLTGGVPLLGSTLGKLGAPDMDASFNKQYELIMLQNEIQQQTQVFNTVSNISKSKHEAAMSAVRNMK